MDFKLRTSKCLLRICKLRKLHTFLLLITNWIMIQSYIDLSIIPLKRLQLVTIDKVRLYINTSDLNLLNNYWSSSSKFGSKIRQVISKPTGTGFSRIWTQWPDSGFAAAGTVIRYSPTIYFVFSDVSRDYNWSRWLQLLHYIATKITSQLLSEFQ